MSAIIFEERIEIPDHITDLDSFRRWARSPGFPQQGRFAYLNGKLWVDMSPEELMSHNIVKGEICSSLTVLTKKLKCGKFFHDHTLVTNVEAGLCTEPDGTFVSYESFKSRRIRLVKGAEGYIEMEGSPDMTLEVVSETSVKKDTITLRDLYWRAGVAEYWLIDARAAELRFDILRRGRTGVVAARRRAGGVDSELFGRSFKLTLMPDELGYPEYTLEIR